MLEQDDLTTGQKAFLDESLRAAQARYNFWRFVFGFLGGMLSFSFYVLAVFRATSLTPELLTLIIAAGEIFGLFTGTIAVMGSNMPEFLKKRLPQVTHLPFRILVCLIIGMLTWITFPWIYLRLEFIPTWAAFWGGIAISIGFIINATFKPHAMVTFAITALAYFAAMFLLNSQADYFKASGLENPLIYFDASRNVFTIGLPMVLLYALGTNAHILWQSVFGGNEVTRYLEGRPFNRKSKRELFQSEPEIVTEQ